MMASLARMLNIGTAGQKKLDAPISNNTDLVRESTHPWGWSTNIQPAEAERKGRRDRLYLDSYNLRYTKDLDQQLDLAIMNDPLFSSCFMRLLTLCDTHFKIELDVGGKRKNKEALEFIEREYPTFFDRNYTIRDCSRWLISRVLKTGVLAAQINPTEQLDAIDSIVFPPCENLGWVFTDKKWQLEYREEEGFASGVILNRESFLYLPWLELQNNDGKFWVPPLKAALEPLGAYHLFIQSLKDIADRTGMQKILDIVYKISESHQFTDLKPGTKAYEQAMAMALAQCKRISSEMQQTLPNGVVAHPDILEIRDLATVEPSANLQSFHDLLSSQVIMGCKLYPAMVGIATRQNQTTLASNQKQLTKAFAQSLQGVVDSFLKQSLRSMLFMAGYEVKELTIERDAPALDSELETAHAERAWMENEILERKLGENEEGVALDTEGDKEGTESKKAATLEIEDEQEEKDLESDENK